jgi:CheY-like chemotaxis protein
VSPVALVVEDDPDWQRTFEDDCRSLGDEVVCVRTQDEAKDELRRRRYDYVVLDRGIPVRAGGASRSAGGHDLLRWIREPGGPTTTAATVPVIVVTAQDDDYTILREALLEGRAVDVWKKTGRSGPSLTEMIRTALRPKTPVAEPSTGTRVFATSVRLHLDGTCSARKFLVVCDGRELLVRGVPFKLLLELAVALRKGDAFVDLSARPNPHKQVSWLREDLKRPDPSAKGKRARVDPAVESPITRLLENDAQGGYRLSTVPQHVTANRDNLTTHHRGLMARLGGWPWGMD